MDETPRDGAGPNPPVPVEPAAPGVTGSGAPTPSGFAPAGGSGSSLPPPPPPYLPQRTAAFPPPPPRRSAGTGWLWTLLVLAVIGVLIIVAVGFVVDRMNLPRVARFSSGVSTRHDGLREVVMETAATRDKIVVIDLTGVISGEPWDFSGNNLVSHIEEQLERAAEDELVKGIILKIDSPGGEVLASDEIYKLILDFQEDHDKPVVASLGTVAASGGYYVAAPCRWIVANDLTITGSIGVIMHSYNWRGLMDKVGVRPQVFKSGELKDMLSPSKREEDITAEERRILQHLVDETFERFKSVVEEGRGLAQARNEDNPGEEVDRGRTLSTTWSEFADGRLLSGREAWKLGLVDELGNFQSAVERALRLTGLDEARLVQYLRPLGFGSLFRLLGEGQESGSKVTIDFGLPLTRLRAGLYYLAPQLAH